jgi:hypothetical protein
MLKRFLFAYLVLFLAIEIKSRNTFFHKRGSHTSSVINKKLYILGGYNLSDPLGTQDEIVGRQFFFLDLSESFTTDPVKNFGPCFIFRGFSINVAYSRNLQPRITEVTRIALGHSVNVTYSQRCYRQYGDMTEIFRGKFFTGR